jgi:hypothetical protein
MGSARPLNFSRAKHAAILAVRCTASGKSIEAVPVMCGFDATCWRAFGGGQYCQR